MSAQVLLDVEAEVSIDPIEEMRLRTWARHNFVPELERDLEWNTVILDEMRRIDRESRNN